MTTSEQIIQVLDELSKRFGVAIDWSKDNVLPYINTLAEKIVRYELWTSAVWVVLSGIVLAFVVRGIVRIRRSFNIDDFNEDMLVLRAAACTFAGVLSAILFLFQLFDIITCLTFPEKVVYEFVSALMK